MTADSLRSPSSTARGSVEPISEFRGSHGVSGGDSRRAPRPTASSEPNCWRNPPASHRPGGPRGKGAASGEVPLEPGTGVSGPPARPTIEGRSEGRDIVKRCQRGSSNPRGVQIRVLTAVESHDTTRSSTTSTQGRTSGTWSRGRVQPGHGRCSDVTERLSVIPAVTS